MAREGSRRERLRFSGWTLDLRRRELLDPSGAVIEISGAEHDLLISFLDNPQRVIARTGCWNYPVRAWEMPPTVVLTCLSVVCGANWAMMRIN